MISEFNKVLDYVEDHLTEDIELETVSQLAMMSSYNFQKIFTVLTEISFGEYVRRRRLSRAVYDLCETEDRILDIAVKYQYESADAFSRSFKRYFGWTPSEVRRTKQVLKTFPRLRVSLKIEGGMEMNYQVVEKEAFKVVGLKTRFPNTEVAQREIGPMWEQVNQGGTIDELIDLAAHDAHLKGTLGVCLPIDSCPDYDYVIGVVTELDSHDHFSVDTIPASKYLVFDVPHNGNDVATGIQQTYRTIYESVLPSSQYTLANKPDFEYYAGEDVGTPDWLIQIWMPVE